MILRFQAQTRYSVASTVINDHVEVQKKEDGSIESLRFGKCSGKDLEDFKNKFRAKMLELCTTFEWVD